MTWKLSPYLLCRTATAYHHHSESHVLAFVCFDTIDHNTVFSWPLDNLSLISDLSLTSEISQISIVDFSMHFFQATFRVKTGVESLSTDQCICFWCQLTSASSTWLIWRITSLCWMRQRMMRWRKASGVRSSRGCYLKGSDSLRRDSVLHRENNWCLNNYKLKGL